ncbi:MAG: DUF5343 domain-containing protein [Anaerolineales bacterium]|nr:DUF5343 domain-containing protein [Anaerolineales bacterium]
MPEKNGFKYVYAVSHIDDILGKVASTGRPDKLTITYVQKSWNLSNAQYSAVLDILRTMEFIDSVGTPLPLYSEYQNDKLSKKVLAKGVRSAYPDLFKAYPKANELSKGDLEGYFRQHSGADEAVLTKIYGTFKKLCSLADFSDNSSSSEPTDAGKKGYTPVVRHQGGSYSPIPITMNIQIVIPNDASEEQYDKIFSSIKKFMTPPQQPDEE